MAKMGIVSENYKADNRIVEKTRMATYKAAVNITVADDKLIVVALDNSGTEPEIKKYTGAAGEMIIGVIYENAKLGEKIAVLKRGQINKEAISMTGITGLKDYEVFELLECQNLLPVTLNERIDF